MKRRLRCLHVCVTRVGIGHFVRTREIARAVSEQHDAFLADAAVPVPDRPIHRRIRRVTLPAVEREGREVRAPEPGDALEAVLRRRRDALVAAVREIRPDVVTIEHFPFSKLEHADEMLAAIEAARAVQPGVRVWSSIRDLCPQPNYRATGADYREWVLETLHAHFDGLLVHVDPAFATLGATLPWHGRIDLPIHYTGFVAEPLSPRSERGPSSRDRVLVSGGGRRDAALYEGCLEAWAELAKRGGAAGRLLELIAPAGVAPDTIADPARLAKTGNASAVAFGPALVDRLTDADLSISLAGYNTGVNLLTTGVPALLLPSPISADQPERASRLARRGLCRTIDAGPLDPVTLADAIEERLAAPRVSHDLDLGGAEHTRDLLPASVT